jgi:hypothetical protein
MQHSQNLHCIVQDLLLEYTLPLRSYGTRYPCWNMAASFDVFGWTQAPDAGQCLAPCQLLLWEHHVSLALLQVIAINVDAALLAKPAAPETPMRHLSQVW